MSRHRLVLPLVAAFACACGSTQKPYNPFKVPRESFYPGLRIVAVAPIWVPTDLEDPEPVKSRFTELVTARLRSAGLTVVSPDDVGPIVEAKTKEAGGVFDPVTGKADEAKAKALDAAIGQEVRARFQADAFLEARIRVVNAALVSDQARWDGATQGAGKGGFWKALLATHSGTIRALSLATWLTDAEGRLLYAKSGGIQVLGKVGLTGGVDRVPRQELFADDERNVNAVSLALDPLLGPAETK